MKCLCDTSSFFVSTFGPMLLLVLLVALASFTDAADEAKPLKSLGHAVLAGAGLVKSASHHDKDVGDIEAGDHAAAAPDIPLTQPRSCCSLQRRTRRGSCCAG